MTSFRHYFFGANVVGAFVGSGVDALKGELVESMFRK